MTGRAAALLLQSLGTVSLRRLHCGPLRPGWPFPFEVVCAVQRRAFDTLWPRGVAPLREFVEGLARPTAAVRRVTRTPARVGGVDGEWFDPPASDGAGCVLYLHGGSYLIGSTRTHADVIARLALAARVRVFGANYRLAPEHPYPSALDDALAVYRALTAAGVGPARVVVAGDSAGGNLALLLGLALRDAGVPQPAGYVCISPWVDLAGTHATRTTHEKFDYGTNRMLVEQARVFAGGIPLDDARVSPLYAPLGGLAPILLQVGTVELLYDECVAFRDRACAAGVSVDFDVLPDMPHAAPLLAELCPVGAAAIVRAGAFTRRRLGLPPTG